MRKIMNLTIDEQRGVAVAIFENGERMTVALEPGAVQLAVTEVALGDRSRAAADDPATALQTHSAARSLREPHELPGSNLPEASLVDHALLVGPRTFSVDLVIAADGLRYRLLLPMPVVVSWLQRAMLEEKKPEGPRH